MALLTIHPLYAEENNGASLHIHFLTTGPNEGRDNYLRVAILKYDEIYAIRIDKITRDMLNNGHEKRVESYFLEGNILVNGAIHELQFVRWLSWNEFEVQANNNNLQIEYEAEMQIPKFQDKPAKEQFIDESDAQVVAGCEGEGCRSEGRYVATKAAPVYSSPNTISKIVNRLIPGELLVGKEQVHAITGIAKIVGKPPKYVKHDKDIPDMDFTKSFEIIYYQGEGWTEVKQGDHFYSIDMMPDGCGSGQKVDSCLEEIRKRRSWVWVSVIGRDRKIEGWVLYEGGPLISIESCTLC